MKQRAAKPKLPTVRKRAAKEKSPVDEKRAARHKSPADDIRPTVDAETKRPAVHLPRIATLFQAVQRDRVGLQRSLEEKSDVYDEDAIWMRDQLVGLESRAVAYLNRECGHASIWPWLSSIRGIGPRLGGMLIGLIDINRCDTVSALWRHAGLAVINGKAERREKGKKLSYNKLLKKTCFLVARQFIMGGQSDYVPFYEEARAKYTRERPEWTKGHVDIAARRKMIKLFLSHLWEVWRTAEGLPVRQPYAVTLPGHHGGYIPPPRVEGGGHETIHDNRHAHVEPTR